MSLLYIMKEVLICLQVLEIKWHKWNLDWVGQCHVLICLWTIVQVVQRNMGVLEWNLIISLMRECWRGVKTYDILAWWKSNGLKYPTLQRIAKDILVIPITTVASKSTFNNSGRLLSPHRSRLHPKTIEAMMCAQNWLWSEIAG